MNKRFALLLLALLPLMSCNREAPAPTVAPPADNAAAPANEPVPADEPAASGDTPPAAPSDAAPSDAAAPDAAASDTPPPAPTPSGSLTSGVDYAEIPNGQPYLPLNGKVEVVEVFGYVCPACAQFQPLVNSWEKKLPANVRFTYVPAPFGGPWITYAKAFYASESMGLVERTHNDLFKAIHIDQTLKGERGMDSVADVAAFYGKHGVDAKQFASTMESFAVNAKVNRAKQWMIRSEVAGTPTIIVNGKYRVLGKNFPDMLRIADALIAQESAQPAP